MKDSNDAKSRPKELISIGKFSKLVSINIKSLRYYDKIGILPPAYTDRKTGYRYYSQHQLLVAEAIKLCTSLDIPLKHFRDFISIEDNILHYNDLIAYGRTLIGDKILQIQRRIDSLDHLWEEIQYSSKLLTHGLPAETTAPSKNIWLESCKAQFDSIEYLKLIRRILNGIQKNTYPISSCDGILYTPKDGQLSSYAFIELQEIGDTEDSHISVLPGGRWHYEQLFTTDPNKIKELYPQLFASDSCRPFIVSNFFTREYNYKQPCYYIGWLLE